MIFSTSGSKSALFCPLRSNQIQFLTPKWKKNRMQHGRNIYFTCVIVDFALLRHQTLHSQNKLFSLQVHNIVVQWTQKQGNTYFYLFNILCNSFQINLGPFGCKVWYFYISIYKNSIAGQNIVARIIFYVPPARKFVFPLQLRVTECCVFRYRGI